MPDLLALTQHSPYAGLFVLLILGGLGMPLMPEDATLMLCGFLLFHGIVQPVPAFLTVYVGLLLADVLIYSFGKTYGEKITGHKRFCKFISPERLGELEERFRKRGFLYILFGRHIIGLRVQILLVAGVMKMQLPRFVLADGLSATITIAIMSGIGYLGGNSLDAIRSNAAHVEHFVALAAIAALLIYVFFKMVSRKNNA